jgi:predicted glycoside hydrolase/deacetylase ChbG (UPF0249 family)
VVEGVLEAQRQGIVTSTTAMINLPGADAAVQRATEEAPSLRIGVHLNLTAGRPVLPLDDVPSLVGPDGHFYSIRELVHRLEELEPAHVRAELLAQIEHFRSCGREPTHLDAHHHSLYLSGRLFRILAEVASRYSLPIRYPWPRGSIGRDESRRLAEFHHISPTALSEAVAACDAILERSGLRTPECCILSFYGPGATLDHLLSLIKSLPDGVTELMCHPARTDEALLAQSGYAEERERELAILKNPRVGERLEDEGVQLTDYSVLQLS